MFFIHSFSVRDLTKKSTEFIFECFPHLLAFVFAIEVGRAHYVFWYPSKMINQLISFIVQLFFFLSSPKFFFCSTLNHRVIEWYGSSDTTNYTCLPEIQRAKSQMSVKNQKWIENIVHIIPNNGNMTFSLWIQVRWCQTILWVEKKGAPNTNIPTRAIIPTITCSGNYTVWNCACVIVWIMKIRNHFIERTNKHIFARRQASY